MRNFYIIIIISIFVKSQHQSECTLAFEDGEICQLFNSTEQLKFDTDSDIRVTLVGANCCMLCTTDVPLISVFPNANKLLKLSTTPRFESCSNHKKLDGVKITIIIADEPQTAHKVMDGKIVLIGGIGIEILHCFKDVLNFSYDILVENVWPKLLDNGSWTGIGKILKDGRADLAIVMITFLPSRVKDFDILTPNMKSPLIAAFYQPNWQPKRNVYLSPFQTEVWVVILITFTAFLSFLALAQKNCTFQGGISITSYILWIQSQISQQGWSEFMAGDKNSSPFSMKLLCWIIVPINVLILLTYYEAKLYTFLSAEKIPIRNVHDLFNSDFYLVADKGSQTVAQLSNLSPKIFSQEYNVPLELILKKKWVTKYVTDAQLDVVSRTAAIISYPDTMITESRRAWNFSDSELCGISEYTKLNFLPFSVPYSSGMMVPKNSPYRNIFNIRLINLMESGILKRLIVNLEILSPRCLRPEVRTLYKGVPESVTLDIPDLFPAFLIFVIGIILAMVAFIIERMKC